MIKNDLNKKIKIYQEVFFLAIKRKREREGKGESERNPQMIHGDRFFFFKWDDNQGVFLAGKQSRNAERRRVPN